MIDKEKARAYDEAKERMRVFLKEWENCGAYGEAMEKARSVFPELAESEDERIRKHIIEILNSLPGCYWHGEKDKSDCVTYLEKQKERGPLTKEEEYTLHRIIEYLEDEICPSEWVNLLHDIYCLPYQKQKEPHYTKRNALFDKCVENCDPKVMKEVSDEIDEMLEKEQKPIKMEVYEVGKGTTICGQDYKCKKDYKEGNCWYIKDVIYHCGRDGYLNDQNGVSWSCTPKWFNEYIYTNSEWADEEKNYFVSGQFLRCKLSFEEFKEGEHYWLEYVGDDMYVGRSDNILNQKFHITPRQLYTLFSQTLEKKVQGPPQEEKQVSLNYEPPFDENPSDKEIIEALIHHLNEQDGFLTAINCVSTKVILGWLKKQKEQKSAEWSEEDEDFINMLILHFNYLIDKGGDSVETYKSYREKLKSLRPQPQWKPSEEQMEALEDAFRKDGSDEYRKTINSLYQDLKKLM